MKWVSSPNIHVMNQYGQHGDGTSQGSCVCVLCQYTAADTRTVRKKHKKSSPCEKYLSKTISKAYGMGINVRRNKKDNSVPVKSENKYFDKSGGKSKFNSLPSLFRKKLG